MRPKLVLKFQLFRNDSVDAVFALIKVTEYNNFSLNRFSEKILLL